MRKRKHVAIRLLVERRLPFDENLSTLEVCEGLADCRVRDLRGIHAQHACFGHRLADAVQYAFACFSPSIRAKNAVTPVAVEEFELRANRSDLLDGHPPGK